MNCEAKFHLVNFLNIRSTDHDYHATNTLPTRLIPSSKPPSTTHTPPPMASPERERKRKRDANGNPRAVATSSHSQQTVKIIAKAPSSHPPLLATVHGVQVPGSVKFDAYVKTSTSTKRDAEGKKVSESRAEYRLHAQTARIEYDGVAEGEDGLSYYVGVYDERTGGVEVHKAPLLHVRRTVRRLKEREGEAPEKASAGNSPVNSVIRVSNADGVYAGQLLASRQALSAAFGNRTSRKALLDEQINAITSSTLGSTASAAVVSAISSAVDTATASLPSSESLRSGKGNSKYLPPIHDDEEGVTVDNVYRLEEMVEAKVLAGCAAAVRSWEEVVNDGGDPESTISPHYVASRIRAVIESGVNVATRLKVLRLIEHIIHLHRLFASSFASTLYRPKIYEKLSADDKSITAYLLDAFTDAKNNNPNDRQLSKTKQTKLFCHLLIFCLKVEEDGKMDLWDLVQDLQVERKEVEMAAREVGARVQPLGETFVRMMGYGKEEAREHRIVRLSVPLVFPKAKMMVRKK
ncbi:LOW QUALITY PROTEIN: DNA-directed RNA polymerase I subunit [Drechslerella dactyloides]|uniref:DNA-directed RNA polymerase I subunit n=1 Tax=Drechslerella dactyloides TaxID=74499 RepID=A0AAD6J563_DREDA|nr:LOW QUALITY PROTEIN: DNA-directed RNA polymerase I subunit [Drechslerella dactyloides]